jgi:hypothetical protein
MKNLITALIKARSQFKPIKKDRKNPYFNSKYADLDSVLAATEPALIANGLVISQTTGLIEGVPVLITTLWHESGEFIRGEYPLPTKPDPSVIGALIESGQIKGDAAIKDDPQKMGSAITYARRYALCAILSVTADDDNDGNEVKPQSRDQQTKPAEKGTLTKEQWLAKQQQKA